jgi:hypothetical protein
VSAATLPLLITFKRLFEQIWLAAIGGARPAGTRSPVNGNPTGTIKVGGKYEFQVWQGTVNVPVISIFPAEEGRRYTSFKADLKKVLSELPLLTASHLSSKPSHFKPLVYFFCSETLQAFGIAKDEYILSVGAGIEIFKVRFQSSIFCFSTAFSASLFELPDC